MFIIASFDFVIIAATVRSVSPEQRSQTRKRNEGKQHIEGKKTKLHIKNTVT